MSDDRIHPTVGEMAIAIMLVISCLGMIALGVGVCWLFVDVVRAFVSLVELPFPTVLRIA